MSAETGTRPFQVGDRVSVTTTYRTQPNETAEGVISEFEPAGFADSGKPFPPYAVVSDDDGNRLTSFPVAFEGNYVDFPEMWQVELLEPAPAPQDHGPLAAPLSDRTLAKVLSRPAHVPSSPTKDAIVESALRWHAIRNANAEDVTPLALLDTDDALHMAVKAHIAAVVS